MSGSTTPWRRSSLLRLGPLVARGSLQRAAHQRSVTLHQLVWLTSPRAPISCRIVISLNCMLFICIQMIESNGMQVINVEEKIVEVTPRDPCAGVEPVGGHIGGSGVGGVGSGRSGTTGTGSGVTGGRTGNY